MVSDFPAGDGKIANLFYSVVRTEDKENEESFMIRMLQKTWPQGLPLLVRLPSSVLPEI